MCLNLSPGNGLYVHESNQLKISSLAQADLQAAPASPAANKNWSDNFERDDQPVPCSMHRHNYDLTCVWLGGLGSGCVGRVGPIQDYNLPPQFSRLGIQGPSSYFCNFVSVVGIGFGLFIIIATRLYTCFSMH